MLAYLRASGSARGVQALELFFIFLVGSEHPVAQRVTVDSMKLRFLLFSIIFVKVTHLVSILVRLVKLA